MRIRFIFFHNSPYTVEPPIMKPPNSEKPLIMKFFQCTICIHFNTFEPPNKENLQIMKKLAVPKLSLFEGFTVLDACGSTGSEKWEQTALHPELQRRAWLFLRMHIGTIGKICSMHHGFHT